MTDTADKHSLKDIAEKDKPADAPQADAKGVPDSDGTPAKSGGGFVWFVLLAVVMGGAIAAGWPYIGPRVAPVVSDVRGLLGLNPRPTQASLPTSSPVVVPDAVPEPVLDVMPEPVSEPVMDQEPAAAPVAAEEPAPVPEPVPEPMPGPEPVAVVEPMSEPASTMVSPMVPPVSTPNADAVAALQATTELTQTLLAMKDELATISARLQALEDGARADPTAPAQALVLGVTQLRSRLTGDNPFAAEVTALEHIAAGDQVVIAALQRLKPHADVGIPSEAALTARFTKVAKAIITARSTSEAGGWLGAVKDGLGGLVTVRRTDPAAITDEVERAVAVAEAALELGELGEAVKALSALQGAPGDAAAAWLGDASARVDAEAALEDLHSHALSVLSSASGA